jgi:hypothetical protein
MPLTLPSTQPTGFHTRCSTRDSLPSDAGDVAWASRVSVAHAGRVQCIAAVLHQREGSCGYLVMQRLHSGTILQLWCLSASRVAG